MLNPIQNHSRMVRFGAGQNPQVQPQPNIRFGQEYAVKEFPKVTPQDIYNHLKKDVIGQDDFLKTFATAAFEYIKRCQERLSQLGYAPAQQPKQTVVSASVHQAVVQKSIEEEFAPGKDPKAYQKLIVTLTDLIRQNQPQDKGSMDMIMEAADILESAEARGLITKHAEGFMKVRSTDYVLVAHNILESILNPDQNEALLKELPRTPESLTSLDEDEVPVRVLGNDASAAGMGEDDVEIKKQNFLILGPTGTGKTETLRSFEKFHDAYWGKVGIKIPYEHVDSTDYTEQGYIGQKISDILERLFDKADYDKDLAELGFVYFDEIDKKAGEDSPLGKDVSGKGFQKSILTFLEDGDLTFQKQIRQGQSQKITLSAKHMWGICGGAFVGLSAIIAQRLGLGEKPKPGFKSEEDASTPDKAPAIETKNLLKQVEYGDLEKFGLMPELLGRIPEIAATDPLYTNDLVRILTEPRNAPVKQAKKQLEMQGVKLGFTEDALKAISQFALETGRGARALQGIVSKVTRNLRFDASTLPPNQKQITIDASYVYQQMGRKPKETP